jgi:hypothetical protein
MTEIDRRARALEDIVMLARDHGLTSAEIAAAVGASMPPPAGANRARSVVVRVLGFLGGTFIFAGIGVFIAIQWSGMNSLARVTATLGTVTAQLGATFQWIRRSTPLFMVLVFASLFWATALDLIDVDGKTMALVLGGSLLLAAAGIDRTPHRDITPPWYFVGAASLLYGFFDLVEHTPFELAFLAAAAAFVYTSVVVHSRTLLFVATLAILAYTGWFTGQYFADSIGWPLALIVFGLFMIGLSTLAFRIDRDYVRGAA